MMQVTQSQEAAVHTRGPRHPGVLLAVGAAALLGACAGDPGEGTQVTTTVTAPAPPAGTVTTTLPPTSSPPSPPPPASTAGDCDRSEFLVDFTDPVVMFCDGAWARAGQAQTDHVLLFRFLEGEWRTHPADGRSPVTEYQCYDEDRLRAAGAPEELIGQVSLCGAGG